MNARTVRWRALAWEGWEHLDLHEADDGVVARGVLIGDRDGTDYGAFYEATLTPAWVFRSIAIRRTDGRALTLRSEPDGRWTDGLGTPVPGLEGCIDIDLSGSPFTNSLPVRRIGLEIGVPQEVVVAWIPLDTLEPFPDRQVYTRLGAHRIRFQSADGSFERDIDLDGDGLVTFYPGLFEAMPPGGAARAGGRGKPTGGGTTMTDRRRFMTGAAALGAGALAAPAVRAQSAPIRWRMQTYAGPALAEHVVKPAIDAFNQAANGAMEIELYTADQLVPTGELFRAMQTGTIDAVQSDDDSMQSPTEVTVFGGYFPFACRYSLDVPVLFHQWGLNEIWEQEYAAVGVKHISAGAWDPCHFATKDPIHSLADLNGKRVFTFPTAGRFLSQFGVVPVVLPWEDIEIAVQTGELDGVAWSGITEDYTVGWANVTNYFLTNNISGAWIGHFFANMDRWNEVPPHLQVMMRLAFDSSHYYRQHWYWGGEANLRVTGDKLQLTTIPDEEWSQVEQAAQVFWDEIAAESEVKARVVQILKDYNAVMQKAGRPYRYTSS